MSYSSSKTLAHIKRVVYAFVGIGFLGLGIFGKTIDGTLMPATRRILLIAGGLFFLYIASMYYFPKNRRRRAELNALLDKAEERERTDLP
jgi:hypothetical protein